MPRAGLRDGSMVDEQYHTLMHHMASGITRKRRGKPFKDSDSARGLDDGDAMASYRTVSPGNPSRSLLGCAGFPLTDR
jgi:hypothetical protein